VPPQPQSSLPPKRILTAFRRFEQQTQLIDEWDRRLQALGMPVPDDEWIAETDQDVGVALSSEKSDIPDRYAFKQTYQPDIDEWINGRQCDC
jgi:hypothetical protein